MLLQQQRTRRSTGPPQLRSSSVIPPLLSAAAPVVSGSRSKISGAVRTGMGHLTYVRPDADERLSARSVSQWGEGRRRPDGLIRRSAFRAQRL